MRRSGPSDGRVPNGRPDGRRKRKVKHRHLAWRLVFFLGAAPMVASGAQDDSLVKISGYVGAVAAPYFCSCGGWPASWGELQRFDDRMHAAAEANGQTPLARFPWTRYEKSRVSTNAQRQIVIDLVAPEIAAGTQIGFDPLECSTALREAMKVYCPSRPVGSRPLPRE